MRLALRRPVEEGNQFIDDGRSVRLRRDIGRDQPLGLDAKRGVDAEDDFEFGGSTDHGVSFGECGAYWGIIALAARFHRG